MSSTEHHPDPVRDDLPPPPAPVTGWPRDDDGDERRPVDMAEVEPDRDDADHRDSSVAVDPEPEPRPVGPEIAGPDVEAVTADASPEPDPEFQPAAADVRPVGEVTSASSAGSGDRTLIDDPEDVRQRWQSVQVGFVDDPRGAIDDAGKLVDEVVELVVTGVAAQRDRLGESWSADDLDTEQLRLALRRYREFLDRLLAV